MIFDLLQTICFVAVLLFASYIDIKKRTVPTYIHVLLFVIGFFTVSRYSFIGCVLGLVCTAVPALVKEDLGGGDVKICASCGFVIGLYILPALIIGMLLAIVTISIAKTIRHKEITSFALVPWISAGCIITEIMQTAANLILI